MLLHVLVLLCRKPRDVQGEVRCVLLLLIARELIFNAEVLCPMASKFLPILPFLAINYMTLHFCLAV